ncbi:unnamed protein product [Discosporangium mesarthrocarpum]
MNNLIRPVIILLLVSLAGCTLSGRQIGTSLETCCPGDYDDYDDYGVRVIDMPIFLRDYVVEEFDTAFQEKGLSRNDQINDLRVELHYNHINLRPDQEDINPFVRVEALTTELSYIAEIEVLMYETVTNNLVWGGSISRIHQVTPGEYMHEGRARAEFLEAFRSLLENYPDL